MFLDLAPIEGRQHGWIEVICGSMFSGKTEELIRRLKRVQFANQKLILVKPTVDDRYHKENVVSHQGRSFDAVCVTNAEEILKLHSDERVVAIDEAQFFDEKIVDLVDALYSVGIKVIDADQGHTDGRRGGDARLTLSSVAHAQLFYGLCDRARCDIPERAGLRGSLRSSTGAWSCGVSWNALPGDSHADATVTVRFPHSDIKTLTKLMRNPPRPAFSSLTDRSLTERSLITESVSA